MADFRNCTKDSISRTLKSLEIPESLISFLPISENIHFLKNSTVFNSYLDYQKEAMNSGSDPLLIKDACQNAYDTLKDELQGFMDKP